MNDLAIPPLKKRAGLLESALLKMFTRRARVLDIEDIGDAFRIVTLGGEALRDAGWTPGDKIQVQLGGWTRRTYTPMGWDAVGGRTRILVYLHAGGPGARWAGALRPGDDCVVFGPRRSVRLLQPVRPQSTVIVVGDETSLGLAAALADQMAAPAVLGLFEVWRAADAAPVIERLQMQGAALCPRLENDGHVAGMEARLADLLRAHPEADVVLTGRAGAIQRMGKLLKRENLAAGRRQSKAYWAPGKTGLD
ncbi:NADPH-dependent ferric siderophore reductase, contains FAD-binding and SIP domains [Duganella sp. CF517]|uniref:siderophore-interacting protein n=1 Tax=Duganella sp. CF517 TaxID=1881038 RepID=UPI0008C16003|nr:siderophore-interacting protein [Duganella sp. CF517]SEN29328.1 NADPH-dependent ferric siderophore reductase, contains FAD-binding and SIP domains [Duganella sp. CF517]